MSTMDERTDVRSRTRAGLARLAGPWWIFLLTGIGWLILAWIALRFAPASIPTVGVLLGVYFLVATINEFVIASVMPRSEEHTSELQSHVNLVCRLLLEKKKK